MIFLIKSMIIHSLKVNLQILLIIFTCRNSIKKKVFILLQFLFTLNNT